MAKQRNETPMKLAKIAKMISNRRSSSYLFYMLGDLGVLAVDQRGADYTSEFRFLEGMLVIQSLDSADTGEYFSCV